jgi:hypothetical protein
MRPIRRLWLYKRNPDTVELVVLGETEECAALYVKLHAAASAWVGWSKVEALTFDTAVIGLVMQLGPYADTLDPIAEAYRMLEPFSGLTWTDGMQTAIGTW